jgi:hypothetical protein
MRREAVVESEDRKARLESPSKSRGWMALLERIGKE